MNKRLPLFFKIMKPIIGKLPLELITKMVKYNKKLKQGLESIVTEDCLLEITVLDIPYVVEVDVVSLAKLGIINGHFKDLKL